MLTAASRPVARRAALGLPAVDDSSRDEVAKSDERRSVDEAEERRHGDRLQASESCAGGEQAGDAEGVQDDLGDRQRLIGEPVVEAKRARDEQQGERDYHQPAQHLVREELNAVEAVAKRVEERSAGDDAAKAARHDPHLAAELVPARRGHRLVGDGCGREDQAPAARDDARRDVEVVGHVGPAPGRNGSRLIA